MKKMLTEDQAQAIAKRLQAWKDRNKENKWIQEVADKKIRELSKRLTNHGSVLVY
jgi:gas vesicle protein